MSEEILVQPIKPVSNSEPAPSIPLTSAFAVNFGKLLSGRLILTVVGATCFYLVSSTVCHIMYEKRDAIEVKDLLSVISTIMIIVSNVFTFYFVRKSMDVKPNQDPTNGSGE